MSVASPTPAQFRAVHGDMVRWQAVDFEIYEHLVENQHVVAPKTRTEPADRSAAPQDPNRASGFRPAG